jgi:hypothetical protein
MVPKRLLTTVATTVIYAGWCHALAQVQLEDSSAGYGSKIHNGQTQAKHPASRFRVDAVQPAIQLRDSPAANTSGQIPNFGGVLQYFANLPDVSLWRTSAQSMNKAPFGGEAVLPLARERAELFGGIGGVYSTTGTPYTRPYTWLTQTKLGGRVALDPGGHFWLGTTAYYQTNFAEKTRQWVTKTADFAIRFGR